MEQPISPNLADATPQTTGPQPCPARRRRGNGMLWLVIGVCLAPVFASYFFYYVVRPDTTTNYGDLLAPPVDLATLQMTTLNRPEEESGFVDLLKRLPENDARRALDSLDDFRGRWLLVYRGEAGAACGEACQQALYALRQIRLATGRERARVERLWLIPGAAGSATPGLPALPADYAGTYQAVAGPAALANWPVSAEAADASGIWIIDPLGNLILRYPPSPDPAKIKKDLLKLLKASRIG